MNIIKADADRKIIVPSAPGKRHAEDTKVTDLLYSAAREWETCGESPSFCLVTERFTVLRKELGLLPFDATVFTEIEKLYKKTCSIDYLVSRGEYLMGKILAEATSSRFCDAVDLIFLDSDGYTDVQKTKAAVRTALKNGERLVVPGFYAADTRGNIKIFSRGGSDITGSILAEASDAYLYENYTDVSGVYAASPRIVPCPKVLPEISYGDLRALSRFGATVLHEDAVFPVMRSMIPIRIRNTFSAEDNGTLVHMGATRSGKCVGISGKRDYHALSLRRDMLGHTPALHERILSFLRERRIYPEQIAFSSDSVTLFFLHDFPKGEKESMLTELAGISECEEITVVDRLMLVTVVGDFLASNAANVMHALESNGITLSYFSGFLGDDNFFFAVPDKQGNAAIAAVYAALFS